jgi:hypothetical protein
MSLIRLTPTPLEGSRVGRLSVYKKVNNSKCQLESYTHPVPNKAANSKFELNKFNFSNLKPYCHSDTCSDSDDVIDSVTSTLSHDSDSDTSISSDDVTDDVGDVTDDVTSSYDFYSDSDTNMSHDFYSDSDTNMSHDFYSALILYLPPVLLTRA